MGLIAYPYARIAFKPNRRQPQGRTIYRPLLPVTLSAAGGSFYQATALADSGADSCIVPLRFARYLKLDVSRLPSGVTAGVGSQANVTYYATISIDLGHGQRFEALVGFTEVGLLGQQGFFENFNDCHPNLE